MPGIQEKIKNSTIEREEFNNEIVKRISEDIQKLHDLMAEQKKNTTESEEALLDMVKEMVNRIKGEIENEKRDRETSEDNLLALLEDTCTKLNLTAGKSA